MYRSTFGKGCLIAFAFAIAASAQPAYSDAVTPAIDMVEQSPEISEQWKGFWVSTTDVGSYLNGEKVGVFRTVLIDAQNIKMGYLFNREELRRANILGTSIAFINRDSALPLVSDPYFWEYASSNISVTNRSITANLTLQSEAFERNGPFIETRISPLESIQLSVEYEIRGDRLFASFDGAEFSFRRIPNYALEWQERLSQISSDQHILGRIIQTINEYGVNSLGGCRGGVRSNEYLFRQRIQPLLDQTRPYREFFAHNPTYKYVAMYQSVPEGFEAALGVNFDEYVMRVYGEAPDERLVDLESLISNIGFGGEKTRAFELFWNIQMHQTINYRLQENFLQLEEELQDLVGSDIKAWIDGSAPLCVTGGR